MRCSSCSASLGLTVLEEQCRGPHARGRTRAAVPRQQLIATQRGPQVAAPLGDQRQVVHRDRRGIAIAQQCREFTLRLIVVAAVEGQQPQAPLGLGLQRRDPGASVSIASRASLLAPEQDQHIGVGETLFLRARRRAPPLAAATAWSTSSEPGVRARQQQLGRDALAHRCPAHAGRTAAPPDNSSHRVPGPRAPAARHWSATGPHATHAPSPVSPAHRSDRPPAATARQYRHRRGARGRCRSTAVFPRSRSQLSKALRAASIRYSTQLRRASLHAAARDRAGAAAASASAARSAVSYWPQSSATAAARCATRGIGQPLRGRRIIGGRTTAVVAAQRDLGGHDQRVGIVAPGCGRRGSRQPAVPRARECRVSAATPNSGAGTAGDASVGIMAIRL